MAGLVAAVVEDLGGVVVEEVGAVAEADGGAVVDDVGATDGLDDGGLAPSGVGLVDGAPGDVGAAAGTGDGSAFSRS